jgi:hypothetical protein
LKFFLLFNSLRKVLYFIKMGSNLNKPFWFNLNYTSHVLLSRQNQLMINQTFWFVFRQHRTRVNLYIKMKFSSFVPIFWFFRTVHKVTRNNTLSNIWIQIIFVYAQLLIIYIYFHSFHQSCELILYISCSSHGSDLYKTLCTPLRALIVLFPLVVDI